ncbi:Competence protein ComEC [Entamoeba marina]
MLLFTGSRNCKAIAERIIEILGTSHVDVAVATHLHADHIGYVGKNGFWYLLESAGITFGKFIDRDAGVVKDSSSVCGEVDDIDWNIVGTYSSTAIKWLCYSTNTVLISNVYDVRTVALPCSNQITPPDDGAKIEIVMSDARGIKIDGQELDEDHHDEDYPPSENDYSIALRIQYGDFVYSTAGDLDGQNERSDYGYLYHDIETQCKDMIGEVDVYHANHHGSSHSGNSNFLNVLKPTVSVISCGQGNSYGHPAQNSVQNMADHSDKIYLTQDCNPTVTDSFTDAIIVNDEIHIHYPTDGVNFYISDASSTFSTGFAVKTNKAEKEECHLL